MTKIIKSISEWKQLRKTKEFFGKSVGFVPTMGALHAGHESLIKTCVEQNDISVVSIFVNPAQFNDPNDFKNYPVTFDNDSSLLEKNKVDFLFQPDRDEIYHDNYKYRVTENELSKILCGAFRHGHFEGVLTIVLKLLNIIEPDKTYFGEKDYQQYKLIYGMATAFFLNTEIIPCPTIREKDGLAMSSRNLLLTEEERKHAVHFPKLLMSKKSADETKKELEELGFKVDYVKDYEGRRFGAVHLGKVRLIDNVQL
ncbi:MAG: pantoate--beta-alanine ligase [Ignavibacteriales bacterium]|nr:pantoate--beta-alanine ligase [Ignavibacteriales bacterium]